MADERGVEHIEINPLIILRSHSIQKYANLEQRLFGLFAHLIGADWGIASIIFYRIVNTRSRNIMLSELLHRTYGKRFDTFWNSLITLVRQLDGRRNEIVHWHTVIDARTDDDGKPLSDEQLHLGPPDFWARPAQSARVGTQELMDFCARCDFASRLVHMFTTIGLHPEGAAQHPPWQQIFAQPVTYPPPNTHPLYPKPEVPSSPPQSSSQ